MFPELEHQLSYIKYANRNLVNPVTDFTKYEEESASNKQDIDVKQPELEQYILDNFNDQFKEIIGEEDVKEVLNIIKEHFTVDWYKRNPILSKINMAITGYYFTKCQSMLIKKLLKKHKYPPEGMEDAVQTVMTQCELWTDNNDMGEENVINFHRKSTSYAESNYAKPLMVAESTATYGEKK